MSHIDVHAAPHQLSSQRALLRLSSRVRTRLKTSVSAAGRAHRLGAAQARVWQFLLDQMFHWEKIADAISMQRIQHECGIDNRQLRRVLRELEHTAELIVREPGCGRGNLSVFALHPRLIERFFPAPAEAPQPEEKGVTATPGLSGPTPFIDKSPDFPHTPSTLTEPRAPAERGDQSELEEVADIIDALPAVIAPHSVPQRTAVIAALEHALGRGYSRAQILDAVTSRPPRKAVWAPAGFLRARLEAMYATIESAAQRRTAADRSREKLAAERATETAQIRDDRQDGRSLWARVPRQMIGRLLGAMRMHRPAVGRRERIAIRSLRADIEPLLAHISDAQVEQVLEQWLHDMSWHDSSAVPDDVISRALSAYDDAAPGAA